MRDRRLERKNSSTGNQEATLSKREREKSLQCTMTDKTDMNRRTGTQQTRKVF